MSAADVAVALGSPAGRALVGTGAAAAIAVAAWRARSLSRDGAVAATVVGGMCAAAGWDWAALLIAFFLTSTALGRVRREQRQARTGGIVAKGGARDATQVLANGGIFALAALGSIIAPSPAWLALGGGALASAASDTWGTEIGSLASGEPWHLVRRQRVPAGTSGAITPLGTLASLGGALLIAALAGIAGWPRAVVFATLVGGLAGSMADSLLGGTVQVRRWCDRCACATEQDMHLCGAPTRVAGGLHWFDNDVVNLSSMLIGAAAAFLVFAAQDSRVVQ